MEDVKYEVKSLTGEILRVYDDKVEISQKGVRGFAMRGLAGNKTIFYTDISSVQFKNCGWTQGFFEFIFPGSFDKKGTALSGMINENRFNFGRPTIMGAKKLANEMEIINNFIQTKIKNSKKSISNSISTADEILKFKNLFDSGIINQEEFEKKKNELLK